MSVLTKEKVAISAVGKSWVIDLPDDFANENDLASGTQVLITFREGDHVSAEVLAPLADDLLAAANEVLEQHKEAFEKIKELGD